MVSLSGEQEQGGYFFRHEEETSPVVISSSQEQILAQDSSSLGLIPGTTFHPIRTVWVACLQILLFVSYETLVFVFTNAMKVTWLCGPDPPFSFLVVLHVGLWVSVFLLDRFLQQRHHKSQGQGYLEFFRETKELRRLPYAILSLGNAVLLVVFAVIGHDADRSNRGGLSLCNILQILFTIEFVLCVPGIIWYLVKITKFNRRKPLPDAEDTEVVNGFLDNGVSGTFSVAGYRDNDYLDEVLEKQADMIRYLQQHNVNLGKRLMKLSAQQNGSNVLSSG